MKALIIEDEEVLAKVLQEKFEKENFETEIVGDGGKAFEAAKNFRPDVVILDIILPNKDGLQILQELKSDPELKNIPVIMSSNLGEDEKIKMALSMGAADYMVKTQHPINEVVEKVRNYLIQPK
jgi:DNA-binding response OmpR family regulator